MRPLPPTLAQRIQNHGQDLTVLVLRLGALGDVLRTLPPVRLLRFALPDARIFWVAEDPWAALLADHPDLDGVLAVPRPTWRRLVRRPWRYPALVGSAARFLSDLRSIRPRLALDFHGNFRSGIVGVASGAGVRLGYEGHQQKEGNRLLTTHRVPAGPRRESRMERNLDLLRALEIPDGPLPDGGLPVASTIRREALALVAEAIGSGRRYAVLACGASHAQAYKRPPAALLGAAARALSSRGVAALTVYGPGERADAVRVVESSSGTATLAPPTDLHLLAALLSHAEIAVAGDTGPLHLACAVGCPVVGIYGPTDPLVNSPWGVPHAAVHPPGRRYEGIQRIDRNSGGFEGIVPAMVENALAQVLDEARLAGRGVPGEADA